MRALILWFAFFATLLIPMLILIVFPPWWLIAIGIGVVFYLRTKSPELVGKLGQALGEEGGSEAEAGLA